MSLFQSKYALVSQYFELGFAAIEAGSSIAPVFFAKFHKNSRLAFLMNHTDSEITFLAVHPDGDATDHTQVHLFVKIQPGDALNFQNFSQDFEPGTTFLVYRSGTLAATSGKIQMLVWG